MSKAVLISIRPDWCEKIARGEKTIEIRKTRPKLETPFKCYIYCTGGKVLYKSLCDGKIRLAEKYQTFFHQPVLNGKVIGEFVCDSIDVCRRIGIDSTDFNDYHYRYCWHISNILIYDAPFLITDFMKPCEKDEDALPLCEQCKRLVEYYGCGGTILRAPRSWCYVEELP